MNGLSEKFRYDEKLVYGYGDSWKKLRSVEIFSKHFSGIVRICA
jgi:hypothetical protein